jgi:hypothetical protein
MNLFFLFLNESYTAGTIKVWLMQKPDYDCVFCLARALHMCGNGMCVLRNEKKTREKLE